MKLKFAKAAAALTIAAAAILTPVAANAVVPYPPTPTVSQSGNIVTVNFGAGSFAGAENVTIILVGQNASSATLAAVGPNDRKTLGTVVSTDTGAVTARIALPSNAAGRYTVTGVSETRPEGVSVSFNVKGSTSGGGGNGGGSLPVTGMDSGSLLGLWVGGGALVLAGGAVAVGAAVHRQRKQAA